MLEKTKRKNIVHFQISENDRAVHGGRVRGRMSAACDGPSESSIVCYGVLNYLVLDR